LVVLLVGDPFEEVAGLAVEGSADGFAGDEADAVLEDCGTNLFVTNMFVRLSS
jgi:hypothetical protein